MRNKGISLTTVEGFLILIVLVLIVLIIGLFFGKYFDLKTIVKSNEVERHAINLAQSLMSHKNLIFIDDNKVHKGIFDKQKLDNYLTKEQNFVDIGNLQPNEHFQDIGYNSSYAVITIFDSENPEQKWIFSVAGSFAEEQTSLAQTITCLKQNGKMDITSIFKILPFTPWDFWDLKKCGIEFASSGGSSLKGFPIAIKDVDSVHAGIMYVRLMEM